MPWDDNRVTLPGPDELADMMAEDPEYPGEETEYERSGRQCCLELNELVYLQGGGAGEREVKDAWTFCLVSFFVFVSKIF